MSKRIILILLVFAFVLSAVACKTDMNKDGNKIGSSANSQLTEIDNTTKDSGTAEIKYERDYRNFTAEQFSTAFSHRNPKDNSYEDVKFYMANEIEEQSGKSVLMGYELSAEEVLSKLKSNVEVIVGGFLPNITEVSCVNKQEGFDNSFFEIRGGCIGLWDMHIEFNVKAGDENYKVFYEGYLRADTGMPVSGAINISDELHKKILKKDLYKSAKQIAEGLGFKLLDDTYCISTVKTNKKLDINGKQVVYVYDVDNDNAYLRITVPQKVSEFIIGIGFNSSYEPIAEKQVPRLDSNVFEGIGESHLKMLSERATFTKKKAEKAAFNEIKKLIKAGAIPSIDKLDKYQVESIEFKNIMVLGNNWLITLKNEADNKIYVQIGSDDGKLYYLGMDIDKDIKFDYDKTINAYSKYVKLELLGSNVVFNGKDFRVVYKKSEQKECFTGMQQFDDKLYISLGLCVTDF